MKNKFITILLLPLLLASCEKDLPLPEASNSYRGQQFGIDKNINEETIDNYLNRTDVVYRDMRMLIDPADYGSIDGDSYLSGFVKGFEVVPFPYIAPLDELPVSGAYNGETLFSLENGVYVSNYVESNQILSELFPRDKAIFLMCGGGGYAGMMKNFLLTIGYSPKLIYNVGGYWFYNGKNSVKVKQDDGTYNWDLVVYHDIPLGNLTKNK